MAWFFCLLVLKKKKERKELSAGSSSLVQVLVSPKNWYKSYKFLKQIEKFQRLIGFGIIWLHAKMILIDESVTINTFIHFFSV